MSTTGHILKIKELINHNKTNKNNTYITFLDVTKAYDKAWLDAIMYVMNKQGCDGATWDLTDRLNQNLTATIRTKHGMTRPININNSIRQGGVLAVTQYATLMDEINKEINKAKCTTQTNIDTNSTCLLWVDDVAIITNNIEDQQTLLSITNNTANKYRIQFGQEKFKLLIIGKSNTNPTIKLGDMTIDPSETYKYLGETLNTKKQHKRPYQRNRKENRGSSTMSPVHSRRWQLPRHRDGNHLDPNRIMHNTNHNIRVWNMGHKLKPNQEAQPYTR